jgi:hypothetical protein
MVADLGQTRRSGRALRTLLDGAEAALNGGDLQGAERIAKVVTALVRAERDLAEFAAAHQEDIFEDDETIRAEIRGRIRRLVEAQHSGAPADVLERLATEGAQE